MRRIPLPVALLLLSSTGCEAPITQEELFEELEGNWLLEALDYEPTENPDREPVLCVSLTVEISFLPTGDFVRDDTLTYLAECGYVDTVESIEWQGSYFPFIYDEDDGKYMTMSYLGWTVREEREGELIREDVVRDAAVTTQAWSAYTNDRGRFLALFAEGTFQAQ
ncbi:MAG: hypothetical protein KTR31_19830 [Myxococcales bacterium]|nr:hypothetical protein [Myxococcales bacterium]